MVKPLIEKHLRAIELRREGKSYSQIKRELQVSKGSLSLWLQRYPLSKEQLRKLGPENEKRIEKFRNTMRLKRERRWREVYEKEASELLPLSRKELYLAGLFLYWGEGGKTGAATTSLSNTNPKVVKFFLFWLTKILKIPKRKITLRLHFYKDMDTKRETTFWSKTLNIPVSQFKKPYIKDTTLRGLTYKGFGHGTCNMFVYGRDLIERVLMGIEVVADEVTGIKEADMVK